VERVTADDANLNTGICGDCGYVRPGPTAEDDLTQCPKCGSANQNIAAGITETVTARDGWRFQVRDGNLSSKKRLRRDIFSGAEQRKSHGDFVQKERVIDKDTNRYRKLIRIESGEIIHDVDEPLTDHFGHGSAKLKKVKPADDTGKP
jgi:hypothetical protein